MTTIKQTAITKTAAKISGTRNFFSCSEVPPSPGGGLSCPAVLLSFDADRIVRSRNIFFKSTEDVTFSLTASTN